MLISHGEQDGDSGESVRQLVQHVCEGDAENGDSDKGSNDNGYTEGQ